MTLKSTPGRVSVYRCVRCTMWWLAGDGTDCLNCAKPGEPGNDEWVFAAWTLPPLVEAARRLIDAIAETPVKRAVAAVLGPSQSSWTAEEGRALTALESALLAAEASLRGA